jgi:hypothetical protein
MTLTPDRKRQAWREAALAAEIRGDQLVERHPDMARYIHETVVPSMRKRGENVARREKRKTK